MVSFEQLLHARLDSLQKAVTDWSETVKKLETIAEQATNGMAKKAEKADWKGENAGVTKPFVKKTAKEFSDAATEAQSIHNILRDALSEFKAAKKKLKDTVDSAPDKGIRIDSNGAVSYLVHPDRRSKDYDGPKPTEADFEKARADIKAALDRANDADEIASRALRTLVGKDTADFSGTDYESLKQAARFQDAEDAKAAAKIVAKGDDATSEEIARLNKYLTDNKGDAYFAERFALEVGVKGSLNYWLDMGDASDGSRLAIDHPDQIKELQKNWSLTLAAATQSHSPAMEQWKADAISSGSDVVRSHGASAYGFQIMSNLMRYGSYDTKFLTDYGQALTVAENKMTNNGSLRAGQVWNPGLSMPPRLNWDGKDLGRDPMVGFMESLGHNAKASASFFNSTIDLTPDNHSDNKKLDVFKYFTKDRDWPEDAYKGGYDNKYGYDSLGHALESATTGHAYDAPTETLKDARTLDNAKVVQKVVDFYGSDPKYMHEQGIADSLAKIGTAYIDEFNRSLEQDDNDSMRELNNSPFGANLPNGKSRFGSDYDENLLFNRGDAINFLSIVAQTEEGHSQLSAAQSVYTANTVGTVGPKPGSQEIKPSDLTDAHTVMRIGSETHGILDNSRIAQIEQDYQEGSKERQKAIGRTTEWIKFGTETLVGGGIAIATDGVASPVVPVVADVVGSATVSALGMLTDDVAEDYAEKDDKEYKKSFDEMKQDALTKGQSNALLPARAYAMAPGWSEENSNFIEEDLTNYVKNARLHSREDNLPDPYKKDD
ncbi:hypothetical protein M3765_11120 [Streptomyces thermoviolaceus]|uniref:hypothetical protein n=1 Tax=Streptomyces thermoviolaceus TaxID=1952 RepID=UPI00203F32F4|nr:hypothetical protein [Streptomyces thermoviolaceus]MCM3264575.1 hypothetical protein [Streptomyces thermoviolaceus]